MAQAVGVNSSVTLRAAAGTHPFSAWVKQQRKVVKKAKTGNYGYYFTIEMLKVPFRVTEGVKGLDPDREVSEEPAQMTRWFKRHKGASKKKLSPKQLKKKQEAAARARQAKQAVKSTGDSEMMHTHKKMSPETFTHNNKMEELINHGI